MDTQKQINRIDETIVEIEQENNIAAGITQTEIKNTLSTHLSKQPTKEEAVQETVRELLKEEDVDQPAQHLYELVIVDLFCGAAGFSTGMIMGIADHYSHIIADEKGIPESEVSYDHPEVQDWFSNNIYLAGVNHEESACRTFRKNHEWARVHNSKVQSLHPPDSVNGLEVDILIAGPSCQPYSKASGGKTDSDQKRMSPFHVLHWLQLLQPTQFMLENVTGFQKLGGWDEDGNMIRDGSMFEQWKSTIENGFGYSVKSEVLHSHNHGDAQSRKRLFIMGRWNYQPEFPEPTHSKTGKEPGMMAYRSAKEIIDWDDHGESIWNRSNPLCLNTNRKMAKGIKEFGMESLHPYADVLSELTPEKIKEMKENAVPVSKAEEEAANRDDPFLVEVPKEEGDPHLILSANEFNAGICSTYTEREDQEPRVRDPNRPLMTIPATKNPARIEQPFLIKYYGKSAEADVNKSMPTITTKSSMGLIIPELYPWGVDIRHRLLKPREAARAQGFPESYEFATEKKTTKRKLIGNAVPINTARALSRKLLEPTDAPTFNKFKGGGQSTTSVQAQKNEAGS